jgi:hypothetical protein
VKKLSVVFVFALMLGAVVGVYSQGSILQRPFSSIGLSSGVGYGTRLPVTADAGVPPTDGELFIVRNPTTVDPAPYIYSAHDIGWHNLLSQPKREEFNFGANQMVEEDYTPAVVTDTSENLIILPGSQLGLIHFRYEAPGGPGYAGTADPVVDSYFDLDNLTDDVDNEGLDFTLGGDRATLGYTFNEDLNISVYCETELRIGDVSETDSVYFGWFLAEAYQDAGAVNGHNTYAMFHITNSSGDLKIETELNGGGTLSDDVGTDYTDSSTYRLKVVMSADSVAFYFNDTQVTQANAVLNADDGDEMVCGGGYLNAAGDGTPATGIRANFFEIGIVNN